MSHRRLPLPVVNEFTRAGRVRTHKELEAIAKKRGVCVYCEIRTHNKVGRAITSNHAYNGICIRHYKSSVPIDVYSKWKKMYGIQFGLTDSCCPTLHSKKSMAGTRLRRDDGDTQPNKNSNAQQRHTYEDQRHRLRHGHGLASVGEAPVTKVSSMDSDKPPIGIANRSAREAMAVTMKVPDFGEMSDAINGQADNISMANLLLDVIPSSDKLLDSNAMASYRRTHESDDAESSDTNQAQVIEGSVQDRTNQGTLRRILHRAQSQQEDISDSFVQLKIIMEQSFDDPNAMSTAVSIIWGIVASSDEKKDEASRCGITESILDIIRTGTTKGNIDAVEWCIGTLACLAQTAFNRRFIAEHDGITTIIDALHRFINNPGVFEWSCRMVHSLVSDPQNQDGHTRDDIERNLSIFYKAQGISEILDAVIRHGGESAGTQWSIRILIRFHQAGKTSPGARIRAEEISKMLNDNGFMLVCAYVLLSNIDTNIGSHQLAAELLYRLLVENDNNPSPAASDFLQIARECASVCMDVVRKHETDAPHLSAYFRLLSALAKINEQCRRVISDGKGVRTACDVLSAHVGDSHLIEMVIQFLWVLSGDVSSFDYSEAKVLCSSIGQALSGHASPSILRSICGLVSNLCLSGKFVATEELSTFAVAALAESVIVTDPTVAQLVTRALASIGSRFPKLIASISEQHICIRMVEGICSPDITTQELCLNTLTHMAFQSDKNVELIFRHGGLFVASALMMSTSSQTLVEMILKLFEAVFSGRQPSNAQLVYQVPEHILPNIIHMAESFPLLRPLVCAVARNALLQPVAPEPLYDTLEKILDMALMIIGPHLSRDAQELVVACEIIHAIAEKPLWLKTHHLNRSIHYLLHLMGTCNADSLHKVQEAASHALVVTTKGLSKRSSGYSGDLNAITVPFQDAAKSAANMSPNISFQILDSLLSTSIVLNDKPIKIGAASFVLECMRRHNMEEKIQYKGCALLYQLVHASNLPMDQSVIGLDEVKTIVDALTNFPRNKDLQLEACRILSRLSVDRDCRLSITLHDGLPILVNAIRAYHNEKYVVEAVCSALMNISAYAEGTVLLELDIVSVIVATMWNHARSSEIQESCLGVLQNMSMISYDAKRLIAESRGIEAVTAAISEFTNSPQVLERAFSALWSLAVLDENQIRIAKCNGAMLVVTSMTANVGVESVQMRAIGCLFALSSNSTNNAVIHDAGGVESIVQAMREHAGSEELQVESCRALSGIFARADSKSIPSTKGIEVDAILAAMQRFLNSARLQEHACVAMRNILHLNKKASISFGNSMDMRELLGVAAARYPDECAIRAIQALTYMDLI